MPGYGAVFHLGRALADRPGILDLAPALTPAVLRGAGTAHRAAGPQVLRQLAPQRPAEFRALLAGAGFRRVCVRRTRYPVVAGIVTAEV